VAADSKAEPALKVTTLATLAEKAENVEGLTKVVEISKSQPDNDSFGRSPLSVTQVGISESSVDGKSTVLFTEWQAAVTLTQRGQPTEAQLVQALVAGKALSRAIWTEGDVETATRLIDDRLSPLVTAMLAAPRPSGHDPGLQAIAEFASDFYGECALRAPEACGSPGDRRMSYRAELSAAVRPRLAGTELAFYAHQLGG
jgi:hypothetical protein